MNNSVNAQSGDISFPALIFEDEPKLFQYNRDYVKSNGQPNNIWSLNPESIYEQADFEKNKDKNGYLQPTTACKLGGNSASMQGALTSKLIQTNIDRGINYGWILGIITNQSDTDGAETVRVIKDLKKNGQNYILRLCYKGTCPDAGEVTQASYSTGMNEGYFKAGMDYGQRLYRLAKKVNVPFWAIAGHNEPNAAEYRPPELEAEFMKGVVNGIRREGYEIDKADNATFLKYRAMINLISPIMDGATDTIIGGGIYSIKSADYLTSMKSAGAPFGEMVALGFNGYFPEHIENALKIADTFQMKLFITEFGNAEVDPKRDVPIANAKNTRLLVLAQFINHPQIVAMLVFNGVTNPAKFRARRIQEDAGEISKKLLSNPFYSYPLDSSTRLWNRTTVDGTKEQICPITSVEIDGRRVDTTMCRAEPYSLNPEWPTYYESTITEWLQSAGCSNIFMATCSDNNIITNNAELNNKNLNVEGLQSPGGSESPASKITPIKAVRKKFSELRLLAVNNKQGPSYIDDSGAAAPGGGAYFDLTDGSNVYASRTMNVGNCKVTYDSNLTRDVRWTGQMLTTTQQKIPTINFLGSTNALGTDNLNYCGFPCVLNKLAYDGTKNYDFTRKADANLQVAAPNGKITSVAFPQLGNLIDLYGYDNLDFDKSGGQITEPNIASNLFFIKNWNEKVSVLSRELQLISKARADKSLGGFQQKNWLIGTTGDAKVNLTIRTNPVYDFGSSASINSGIAGKYYTKLSAEEQEKIQFNSDELMNGETNLSVEKITAFTKCTELYEEVGGDPLPVAGSDAQLYPKCNAESIVGSLVKFKDVVRTKVCPVGYNSETGEYEYGQPETTIAKYTSIPTQCYQILCAKKVKKIATPVQGLKAGYNLPIGKSFKNGDAAVVWEGKSDEWEKIESSSRPEGRIYKKLKVDGSKLVSASGLLKVIRAAWEQSERVRYEVSTTKTGEGLVPLEQKSRICHFKGISLQVKNYTRQYSVNNESIKNINTGSVSSDQCVNSKNEGQSGYRRYGVDAISPYVITTTELPWMGTVTAIQERLARVEYNYLPQLALPLKQCGGANSDIICICQPEQKDDMALFLCRAGMLTQDEMDLEDLTAKDCQPRANVNEINGVFSYGDQAAKKGCVNALNDPRIREMINRVSCNTGTPAGVITAIWSNETGCSYPGGDAYEQKIDPNVKPSESETQKNLGILANAQIWGNNNQICAECIAEVLGGYNGTEGEYQQCLTVAAKSGKTKCDKYAYLNNVACCDVRGALQFNKPTFDSLVKNQSDAFNKCRAAIGAVSSEVSRANFGDILCASGLLLNNSASGNEWNDQTIARVAGAYYGTCGSTSYCSNAVANAAIYGKFFDGMSCN